MSLNNADISDRDSTVSLNSVFSIFNPRAPNEIIKTMKQTQKVEDLIHEKKNQHRVKDKSCCTKTLNATLAFPKLRTPHFNQQETNMYSNQGQIFCTAPFFIIWLIVSWYLLQPALNYETPIDNKIISQKLKYPFPEPENLKSEMNEIIISPVFNWVYRILHPDIGIKTKQFNFKLFL